MQRDGFKRILWYALGRTEAYLIVGLVFVAVVVAIIGRWPGWVILAGVVMGVILLALLVVDSLSDPGAQREASIAGVDPGRIRDAALRAKVRRALDYIRASQKLARQDSSGVLDAADDELPQLEAAARSIYQMSLRLQDFRSDRLIPQDLASLGQEKSRRGHLDDDREAQLASLQRLDLVARSAEQEIDRALAHLGRSYAEMQAIRVTPELRGHAAATREELHASTKRLAELAQGYDEVYGRRSLPARS